MNDDQLLRYSRHILLPEIGVAGQETLLNAHAFIVGAGGLGSPIALYLAASGVGTLTIADGDVVELTNLQRQIAHTTQAIGRNKARSAQSTLANLNPEVTVNTIQHRLTADELMSSVPQADVVIDASDNFATRHAVNRACVAHKKPLVSGAALRFDGQVSVFDLRAPNSPCYACLYPETAQSEEVRCVDNGVFSPLVGIVGSIQAAETLKCLLNMGETLNGRLLLIEGLTMNCRAVKLNKDPRCAVCGN